jgi:hypothetical protein
MTHRPILLIALCPILHAADLTGEQIMRNAVEANRHQEALRQQYLYREHQENGPAKPDGGAAKVRISRDFEVIFLEGDFYRRLVALDGKPLSPKQAREEEEKMRMTAAERIAKHPPKKVVHTGVPLSAEWEVIGAGVDMKPGSTTKLIFARNQDGAWLLDRAELLILNGDKLGGNRFFQTNTFSDYKRFTSETSVQFDDDPPL